jgi:hypothetical protein
MKTNMEIAQAWKNGNAASNRSMSTDGVTLWSYAMPIGYTDQGKKIAIRASISSTTNKHMACAMRKADVSVPAYDDTINPSSYESFYNPECGRVARNLHIPRIGVTYLVWWDSKVYKTLRGAERKAYDVGGVVKGVRGGYRVAYMAYCQ